MRRTVCSGPVLGLSVFDLTQQKCWHCLSELTRRSTSCFACVCPYSACWFKSRAWHCNKLSRKTPKFFRSLCVLFLPSPLGFQRQSNGFLLSPSSQGSRQWPAAISSVSKYPATSEAPRVEWRCRKWDVPWLDGLTTGSPFLRTSVDSCPSKAEWWFRSSAQRRIHEKIQYRTTPPHTIT